MRKSFYQLLQLIEGSITNQHNTNQYYNSNIRQILNSIQDEEQRKIIAATFALYCAEDCSQLIPENNELKSLIQQCIAKIKSWLIDSGSITPKQLRRIGNNVFNFAASTPQINAHWYAACAVADVAANVAANTSYDDLYYNAIDYSSMAASNAINAFYEINNQNENIRQQKIAQYKNYLITLISNIEFDTNTDKELFINQITNNNTKSPQFWNTDEWLYFFTLAQDEYAIPLITQHNDSWIINPNLGNYNIETKDPMQLINYITTNPDLKNFRLQLYDKIIDTI